MEIWSTVFRRLGSYVQVFNVRSVLLNETTTHMNAIVKNFVELTTR